MPFHARLERAREAIHTADALLIGAGAGLSTAAGVDYGGQRFRDAFPDFIERYGLTDMYSSAFFPFPTPEERWAYMSRHIQLNRFDAVPGELYTGLAKLCQGREHFVITTNVDSLFFEAGFERERVFATQGDYGLFQCKTACHDGLYDNQVAVTAMVEACADCRIPTHLVPTCPVCAGPLAPHLRVDGFFVEDQHWHDASRRYRRFIEGARRGTIALVELGVGYNTPGIIKFPFEKLAARTRQATLIRINRDHPAASQRNRDRTIAFGGDLAELLPELLD